MTVVQYLFLHALGNGKKVMYLLLLYDQMLNISFDIYEIYLFIKYLAH